MKIGIITHWKDNDNYGAALQSYALQRYLRNLGHDAYVIRYYQIVDKLSIGEKLLLVLKNPFLPFKLYKSKRKVDNSTEWNKKRDFQSFRNKHIVYSDKEYHGLDEIRVDYPVADLYVTGSDQVWHNPLTNRHSWPYFLCFGNKETKRVSYAASFGRNYFPCVDEKKFKELLSAFNMISMREESGREILKERGFESVRCLDSTLLLDYENYKLLMAPRKHKQPFAFYYTVNVTDTNEIYWDRIKLLFEERGWANVVTTGAGYGPAEEVFDGATYDYATVEGWLSNIFYSNIVVTASFHGIVFSLMLHKDFIYMPLQGKYSKGNDRITDLLKSVGLMDRMARTWDDVQRIIDEHIDYGHLEDDKFKELRKQSYEFLNRALSL